MAKIITLSHQKGGVGKSTLAFNLAQKFKDHIRTAIVDLDVQGTISQLKNQVTSIDIIPYTGNIDDIKKLDYDVVFVDTPPYLSSNLPSLFKISDLIIVPTKAGIADVMAIGSTINLIKENNKLDKSVIVLNMVKPNTTLTDDSKEILQDYKIAQTETMISDLVSFTRSFLTNGISDNSDKKAVKQLDDLTNEVLILLN